MPYPNQCGKGQTQPDGTYIYTCNACNGTGVVNDEVCHWCYALNTSIIAEKMSSGVRGQQYYALLKAFISVNGKEMVEEAKAFKSKNGKITPHDLLYISLRFKLNWKATVEWLEETYTIPSGTYELLQGMGFKPTKEAQFVKERYDL